MKDFANIIFVIAVSIVAVILVGAMIVAGATWYIESRWGVEGVEKALNLMGWIGAFLTAAAVIGFGWFLANRSHVEGARTANSAQENTAQVLGEMFKTVAVSQKAASSTADASMAKAYAAQAGADAQIRVLNYKAELETQRRVALPAPSSEPVRRAPWEIAGPADDSGDDDFTDARFKVMH